MKQPLLRDDAFLKAVRAAPTNEDTLSVWWLGQSGFLVAYGGAVLLLDPYLSDSLTHKYANTDKPHVRLTERVIAPERLDFVDVVTSSHNHTDHLDGETLGPLLRANPELTVIVPRANVQFAAERLGVLPERLTPAAVGETVTREPFTFHAVPAAHNDLDRDEAGHYRYVGYVVTCGPFTLYHSGDTLWYEGLVERLSPWAIDVALLPINGNVPERRVAGNLDGREAVELARTLDVRLVVPCHYDMFAFNTASPDAFIAAAEAAGQPVTVLQNGEGFTLKPTR